MFAKLKKCSFTAVLQATPNRMPSSASAADLPIGNERQSSPVSGGITTLKSAMDTRNYYTNFKKYSQSLLPIPEPWRFAHLWYLRIYLLPLPAIKISYH